MVGRIETYLHSDTITENKGGALVKVTCDTDFAAKTPQFRQFAAKAAKFVFAANATSWADVVAHFPELDEERAELAATLKEKIEVSEIAILLL